MTAAPFPAERTSHGKLRFVEVGRGLAALAVVIFHANASAPHFGGATLPGLRYAIHGVDFFFVLSGFIILHAHRGDIGRPATIGSYALKRAIRLLPILWAVVGGWAALRLALGVPVDAATLFRSLIPYPSLAPTEPMVVWTLRHELVFYGVFAILLLSRRVGFAIFAAWLALIAVQFCAVLAGRAAGGVVALLLSGFSIQFMLGMVVAIAARRWPRPPSAWPLLAGLLLLAAMLAVLHRLGIGRIATDDYVSVGATWGTAALGIAFAAILYGLVRIEGCWRAPAPLLALGAASYAIYLVHTPANSFGQRVAAFLPDAMVAMGAGHLLLIAIGLLVGWIVHRGYERPVTRALRHRWLSRKEAMPSGNE